MLTVAYTAPILVGGLLARLLLAHFCPRRVKIVDNRDRGAAFAVRNS